MNDLPCFKSGPEDIPRKLILRGRTGPDWLLDLGRRSMRTDAASRSSPFLSFLAGFPGFPTCRRLHLRRLHDLCVNESPAFIVNTVVLPEPDIEQADFVPQAFDLVFSGSTKKIDVGSALAGRPSNSILGAIYVQKSMNPARNSKGFTKQTERTGDNAHWPLAHWVVGKLQLELRDLDPRIAHPYTKS